MKAIKSKLTIIWLPTMLLAASTGCGDDASSSSTPDSAMTADAAKPDSAAPDGNATPDQGPALDQGPAGTWAVLVRGALFTTDLAKARTLHDGIASGGESAAKAAGDIGHDVLLGTTMLGTTENEFLGVDLWTSLSGMEGFYNNPAFAKEFAKLFSGSPPLPEMFVHQPGWHGWGTMSSGDAASTYYFVVARGRLAATDPAAAQTVHDQVAAAGEAKVKAAGDVAHVVYTGLTDPREFLAVDIWTDATNLTAVYSDPEFQKGFGQLFEGAPTLAVYASTDWHQW